MPKKPIPKKERVTVVVNSTAITVTLHPPTGSRKSWYAYWSGLTTSKSTGCTDLGEAVAVVQKMLENGGGRPSISDSVLTDDEFRHIQKVHYGRKQEPSSRKRAEKSLTACLEAIDAFVGITGITPIACATADDCAAFQRNALTLRKNWRLKYPNQKTEGAEYLSPNTILKWSRALQAAFERANINSGKKCVRGVVDNQKLLRENPWHGFTWIEGRAKDIRQFTDDELQSVLAFFTARWPDITIVTTACKLCFWTWARLSELANIQWQDLRRFGDECHFEIQEKMGGLKWARIPTTLCFELERQRTGSPFVLAAYAPQMRRFFASYEGGRFLEKVSEEYKPEAFASWFQDKVCEWSDSGDRLHATPHVFRKTALQRACIGEDRLRDERSRRHIAMDANLNVEVMRGHYVKEEDEQRRQASNRMYQRILAGVPGEIAELYGYAGESPSDRLRRRLLESVSKENWAEVAALANELIQVKA